ncbi:MAG TPA: hypothetical protein VFO89_03940, partial [Thermoanaerobaculia bacterium]|nr:hypothetical protein [Thermoanaerobaculia bacterium]
MLEQGIRAHRAGNPQAAVQNLEKAAQAFLSPERMQAYVATGRYEGLASLERTLVYLALAQSRLGHSDEARAAIQRLVSAEKITPAYATLGLPEADAAAFEALARSVLPSASLPKRIDLAGEEPAGPLPAVRARGAATEAERIEREKVIAELFAQERERAERQTESRIAAEKAAAEKAAAERIAAERAAAEKAAAERIATEKAAAEKAAAERIAREKAAAEKAATERIAAERAAAEKAAAERIATEKAAAEKA